MDEILFRGAQTLESLQVQLSLTTQQTKVLLHHHVERIVNILLQLWKSPQALHIQTAFKELSLSLHEGVLKIQEGTIHFVNGPKELCTSTRQHLYSACFGLALGGLLGFYVGIYLQKPVSPPKYMKAVVCTSYNGLDGLTVIDDILLPSITQGHDILIQVKSSSVDNIDVDISTGYGKCIRKCLAQYFNKKNIFPIIVGRSCSGIITEIGCRVTTVDIGDEVWVSLPIWCEGTLSEFIVTKECFVNRKPTKLSFEGAASLAYSGCMALNCLTEAQIYTADEVRDKHILIEGCCSPVGCVLSQILKSWGCDITTTCSTRAAPVAKAMGSKENIVIDFNATILNRQESLELLLKELELRASIFDIIFVTSSTIGSVKELQRYSKLNVVNALPKKYVSDNCGLFLGWIISTFLRLQYRLQCLWSTPGCDSSSKQNLQTLQELVEDGSLQSVVDHIYPLHEFELAVAHKLSSESIGNTIIKFT